MIKASEVKNRVNKDLTEILEGKIDEQLQKTSLVYEDRVEVIISGEYNKEVRDALASKYVREGEYSKATHHTSSENGERPGLTSFIFYF